MATTLTEVNATLVEIRDEQKETTNAVTSLTAKISAQMEAAEMNRLRSLNQPRVSGGSAATIRTPAAPAAADAGGGTGGMKLAGLGLGLGALGAGAMKGAAGLTAMGLAIPAFFGGLLAGSEGLSWLQDVAGMDYEGLKKAALGFADIIMEMDPKAFVVLGGIMGISAVGGTRGAAGLATMGLAISGFLGGLLAGSELLSLAELVGADLDYGGLKKAMVGFSDMIMGLDPDAMVVMAGALGIGALTGLVSKNPLDLAKGMSGLAAGIFGFLGGLVIANDVFSFAETLGADLDYTALGQVFAGFSQSIGQLTPEAATALAGVLGVAGVLSKFGGAKGAANAAAIMTGIGAGIGGLMIGLSAGDAGITWINKMAGADGTALVGAFKMFNDSVAELNNENAIIALAGILGVGGAIGALVGTGGVQAGVGIFAIMSGIGAGIAGLMVGLATGDFITSYLQQFSGNGEGIVGVFKTFNNSILAISPEAIQRIGELNKLGGFNIAGAMAGLAGGMVTLFGADGLMQIGSALKTGVLETFDWLFGTNTADNQKSAVETMIDSLEPLTKLDPQMIPNMDALGAAIGRFSDSFASLQDIDGKKASTNLTKMIADMGGVLQLLDPLINGGEFNPNEGSFKGFMQGIFGNEREVIKFGKGLKGLEVSNLNALAEGVNALRAALGVNAEPLPTTGGYNGDGALNAEPLPTTGGYNGDGAFQLDEINVQVPRDVSIVRMSDEVLNALTAVLMQQDYEERVATTGGGNTTIIQEGDTTNNNSSQGITMPPPSNNDHLDAGFSTRQRRGGPR